MDLRRTMKATRGSWRGASAAHRRREMWLVLLGSLCGQGSSHAATNQQGLSAQGLSAQGLSAQGLSAQGLSAQGLSAQGLSAQGLSAQGLSAQGLSAQGLSAQGLSAQGLSAQGLSAQGLSAQGVDLQGLSAQGLSAQGLSAQGLSAQGLSAQGLSAQSAYVGGPDVEFGQRAGAAIDFVTLRGTTPSSADVAHQMAVSATTSGAGTYITVGGDTAVGHYAVAHMADASGVALPNETLDLYIASVQQDQATNLFHEPSMRSNADVWLYTVYAFHPMNRQWVSLCPVDVRTGAASAVAIAENPAADPNRFIFACTATGVDAKCARAWGYKPWRTDAVGWEFSAATNQWVQTTHDLKPFYDACKIAARAAYCQDEKGFTKNGTLVDLYDTVGLVWSNTVDSPNSALMFAQEFNVAVAPQERVADQLTATGMSLLPTDQQLLVSSLTTTGLQRTRYRQLAPEPDACRAYPWIDRLERDQFEDARWMSFVNDRPRLVVLTPTYCSHSDEVTGAALAWDCNRCTARVCADMPSCCRPDGGWVEDCVTKRHEVCRPDRSQPESPSNPAFPAGIAIPAITDSGTPLRFLTGPIGSVETIAIVSGDIHVRGWACDPSAPGVRVRVRVFGNAPPGEPGSVDLTPLVRLADLPVDPAFATGIGAACGDPAGGPVRRLFDIDSTAQLVPARINGKFYVYAEDAFVALPGQTSAVTPLTLLRNGIQQVGGCAHGEFTTGAALDATCSPCAAKVCATAANSYCCNASVPRGWDDNCVLLASGDASAPAALNADACTSTETSAQVHAETFSAVRTGWIEPLETGNHVFCVDADDSTRLWINGQLLVDHWNGTMGFSHTCSSPIRLVGGVKYHVRWDFFEGNFLATAQLYWRRPVTATDALIPATALYNLYNPGASGGVQAEYWDDATMLGGPTHTQREPSIGAVPPPVVPFPDPYSARWTGVLTAPTTESYTFTIADDGDSTMSINGAVVIADDPPPTPSTLAPGCLASAAGGHDICDKGVKLDATCSPCAATICQFDPFCCNGGYVSPYVTEPEWDAKCVAQVKTLCNLNCTSELAAGRRTRRSAPIALMSGAKYDLVVTHHHTTSTSEAFQLLWQSARVALAPIAGDYLAAESTPQIAGTGFNTVYYNNNDNNGIITPDLANPATSRHEPVFDVASSSGGPSQFPSGANMPRITSPLDWTAPPPSIVSPADGSTLRDLTVHITGYGVQSGMPPTPAIPRITLSIPALGTSATYDGNADGSFAIDVALPANGTYAIELRSLSNNCDDADTCIGATGSPATLNVTVAPFTATSRPPAPIVTDPTDPTHTTSNQVHIVGGGLPGATITVTDEAVGADVGSTVADAQTGDFATTITLSDGWHKLVFRQQVGSETSDPTFPVYISVRIPPPIVQSPPTGTELTTNQVTLSGEAGGSEDDLGRLYVAESDGSTGVGPLNPGGWEVIESGGTFTWAGTLTVAPGKHLFLVYQTTVADGLYPFLTAATTPTSRIEVDVKPAAPGITTPAANTIDPDGSVTVGGAPGSAVPGADINVVDGPRTWTTTVLASGEWSLEMFLDAGWHDLCATQVVNASLGGGWMESVCSALLSIGVVSPANAPTLVLPGLQQYEALAPNGRIVDYRPSATSNLPATPGAAVAVTCVPASGSPFAIGDTEVHCTATDPGVGGGTAVGSFTIRIVDGPPVIVGAVDRTAEATDPLGADVSFDVTAEDAVSGPAAVNCDRISGSHFPLGFTTVTCDAFDGTGHHAPPATFTIEVTDHTPPSVVVPPDITVQGGTSGAIVTFNPTASDLVDGPNVPVTCVPAPGSNFVGTTAVACTATDNHNNTSLPATFRVIVQGPQNQPDTTPPVVTVPADMNVVATSNCGAVVKFSASAVDAVDGPRSVTCKPASGSTFPLGTTMVTCSASDKSRNVGKASFKIAVAFSWSGFQAPISADGSASFKKGAGVSVKFRLTGASAAITDLNAKLYAAKGGANPTLKGTFRYSRTDKTYCLDLATGSMAAGSWQLRIDMGDGVTRAVDITIRQ